MISSQLNFVGVGPQRTGTSWMHSVFESHPRICLPRHVKETMFFDRYYDKGPAWYFAHFKHRKDGEVCGEFGPSYFDCEQAQARIQGFNNNCKIIINVRNPLDRALSMYHLHLTRGRLRCSFREALKLDPRIVRSGKYAAHVPRWLNQFGVDRVMFVCLDDIRESPISLIQQVSEFINIPWGGVPASLAEKVGAPTVPRSWRLAGLAVRTANWLRGKRLHWLVDAAKRCHAHRLVLSGGKDRLPRLTRDEREELLDEYRDDIAYLEDVMNRSFSNWRTAA